MKNNFEHIIKESLDSHEVPYEAGAWERFEKNLAPSTPFYKSKWFIGGAALLAIVTSVALFNTDFDSPNSQLNSSDNSKHIAKNELTTTKTTNSVNPTKTEDVKTIKTPTVSSHTIKENHSNIATKKEIGEETKDIIQEDLNTESTSERVNPKEIPTVIPESNTNIDSKPRIILNTEQIVASFYIEQTICKGNLINLIAENTEENYNYSWKLNDQETVFGKVVTMQAEINGDNTITLFITKDGKEISKKTSSFKVLDSPSDIVKISANEFALVNELKFEMDDLSNQISWDFGDGTKSTNPSEIHTYNKAKKYICKYTITSSNGCKVDYERNINIKGYYNLRADYGFSPNNDNLNDVFIPVELKDIDSPFEMTIYSRSGQLIYTTTSLERPWDGKLKDGSTCKFGSYVWVVSLTNKLGEKEIYKGTLTNVGN